jgi:microcystin-dependent protein
MSDAFIGQIKLVPYSFAPRGWAFCNGQLLSIAQNTALFSLLGTQYGGNGIQTFALPDLRGRVATHYGNGQVQGERSGSETVTLIESQLPSHTHQLAVSSSPGFLDHVAGEVLAATDEPHFSGAAPVATLHPGTVGPTGAASRTTTCSPTPCSASSSRSTASSPHATSLRRLFLEGTGSTSGP